MKAAITAQRLGLSVIIADENAESGGQIYRRVLSNAQRPQRFGVLGSDYRAGYALALDFSVSGASWRPETTVFEVSGDGCASLVGPHCGAYTVRAQAVLFATGAYERALPVPGWTLPGVMTAGAAQTMLKTSGHIPAGRVVLVGCGPLLWYAAWQLRSAGADVAAVLSFTPAVAYLRHAAAALAAWHSAGDLAKGAKWLASLQLTGPRVIHGVRGTRIDGASPKLRVFFEAGSKSDVVEAATVLLHVGVIPNIQASKSLRVEHDWDPLQFCWRPRVNAWGVSSKHAILIAGDGAGIAGVHDAVRGGELAVLGLAERLGRITTDQRNTLAAPLVKARARERKLRIFLDALYAPPEWARIPSEDTTLVCRCEEVTVREIRTAVRLGANGPNQVKAYVRAGMGACQGRMCAHTVSALIAHELGIPEGQMPTQQVRPPLKPVHLGDLAVMDIGEEEQSGPSITAALLHAPPIESDFPDAESMH